MTYLIPAEADFSSESIAIAPGSAGAWDIRLDGAISPCCVAKLGSTYYVYYIGADGDRGDGGPANRALGVAYGSDPTSLTKYAGNPIITFQPNAGDEEGIFSAACFVESGTIHLYYGGLRDTGGGSVDIEIRYQNSTDGVTFANDTLILQDAGNEDTPVGACKVGSTYNCYYLNDLSGGAGNLRRRSGSAADSLGTDTQVTAGTWRGSGDINFLSPVTLLTILTDPTTRYGQAYTIASSDLDTLSSLQETYNDGYKHRTIYLDTAADLWIRYLQSNDVSNNIYVSMATADTIGVDIESGSYVISGQDVGLGPAGIIVSYGTYALTGSDISFAESLMAEIKWNAPDAKEDVMTTELNSLADGDNAITGTAISNDAAGELDLYGNFKLYLATQGSARDSGAYVSMYILPEVDTDYAYGGASPDPAANLLAGNFLFDAATTARHAILRDVLLPPTDFHVVLINETGQALASTGNTLELERYNLQSA